MALPRKTRQSFDLLTVGSAHPQEPPNKTSPTPQRGSKFKILLPISAVIDRSFFLSKIVPYEIYHEKGPVKSFVTPTGAKL